MTSPAPSFTFTGDRDALEAFLQDTPWRIAHGITMDDGSLLLYLDNQPYTVRHWAAIAPGQTLMANGELTTESLINRDSVAGSLAAVLDKAWMVWANLADAETCRQINDPKSRARNLRDALESSGQLVDAMRSFQAGVAYDNRDTASPEPAE
jgi:hypothetical protein